MWCIKSMCHVIFWSHSTLFLRSFSLLLSLPLSLPIGESRTYVTWHASSPHSSQCLRQLWRRTSPDRRRVPQTENKKEMRPPHTRYSTVQYPYLLWHQWQLYADIVWKNWNCMKYTIVFTLRTCNTISWNPKFKWSSILFSVWSHFIFISSF